MPDEHLEDLFDECALDQARFSKLPARSSTVTVRGWPACDPARQALRGADFTNGG